MVARKLDGFDHFSTAHWARKVSSFTGVPTIVQPGRFGGGMTSSASYNVGWTDTFDSQATWIVGFAFKTLTIPAATCILLTFLDTGTIHTDFRINNTGVITATRNGTLLATGTTVLLANTWYFLEFKVTISDTVGVVAMQVDGVAETFSFVTGTSTTQDTRNAANASANQIKILSITNSGNTINIDDYYVFDGTGAVNNNFNGPARIWTGYASEVGNSAQFTASPGPNFANVGDSPTSDDDATINYSTTANHIDSFKFTDPPISAGTATAYQHVITARTDGAGARTLAAHQRSNGSNYTETAQSLSSSWAMYRYIRNTNPDTSSAITATELKDAEFGYKLIS